MKYVRECCLSPRPPGGTYMHTYTDTYMNISRYIYKYIPTYIPTHTHCWFPSQLLQHPNIFARNIQIKIDYFFDKSSQFSIYFYVFVSRINCAKGRSSVSGRLALKCCPVISLRGPLRQGLRIYGKNTRIIEFLGKI